MGNPGTEPPYFWFMQGFSKKRIILLVLRKQCHEAHQLALLPDWRLPADLWFDYLQRLSWFGEMAGDWSCLVSLFSILHGVLSLWDTANWHKVKAYGRDWVFLGLKVFPFKGHWHSEMVGQRKLDSAFIAADI